MRGDQGAALGLSKCEWRIRILEDVKIMKEHADGSKEIMPVKEKVQVSSTIKKGTILLLK